MNTVVTQDGSDVLVIFHEGGEVVGSVALADSEARECADKLFAFLEGDDEEE